MDSPLFHVEQLILQNFSLQQIIQSTKLHKGCGLPILAALVATAGGLCGAIIIVMGDIARRNIPEVICLLLGSFTLAPSILLPIVIWRKKDWISASFIMTLLLSISIFMDWITGISLSEVMEKLMYILALTCGFLTGMGSGVLKSQLFTRFLGAIFGIMVITVCSVLWSALLWSISPFYQFPLAMIVFWASVSTADVLFGILSATDAEPVPFAPLLRQAYPHGFRRLFTILLPITGLRWMAALSPIAGLIVLLGFILYRSSLPIHDTRVSIGRPEMFLLSTPTSHENSQHNERRARMESPEDFAISQTIITEDQFQAVINESIKLLMPSELNPPTRPKDAQPIPTHRSLELVVRYCNKLSELEGKKPCYTQSDLVPEMYIDAERFRNCPGYRLPFESEWEYAAPVVMTSNSMEIVAQEKEGSLRYVLRRSGGAMSSQDTGVRFRIVRSIVNATNP